MAPVQVPPPSFPVGALVVNVIGLVFTVAGLLGLLAPEAVKAVPALGDPLTAWTLLGVGVVLDLGSCLSIVRHLRSRSS